MTTRFGILGAAQIAPTALIRPAVHVPGARVVAVAARDPGRAHRFATEWGIARAHESYAGLLDDDGIDAVYVALPASKHARWSIDALRAGKHVLVEKPMATDAAEAMEMAEVAKATGKLLVEAMHWRYHPVAEQLLHVVADSGGPVRTTGRFTAPVAERSDIRYQLDLAGGAMLDLGCYPLHWARTVAGETGAVVAAEAVEASPGVDLAMQATLAFPSGTWADVSCSMKPGVPIERSLLVVTPEGSVELENLLAPDPDTVVVVNTDRERWHLPRPQGPDGAADDRTTYEHQLLAFVRAVNGGPPPLTTAASAVETMRLLDQAYAAAGLAKARATLRARR